MKGPVAQLLANQRRRDQEKARKDDEEDEGGGGGVAPGTKDPLGWGQGGVPEAGFQGFASRASS